jgi:acyl-CoA synthetase (AMP-forming)/AMP-acid ligase II
VSRVAVVGMPDRRLGEVGMAFVVRAPGAELGADALIYKVPRAVEFVEALPVNATGRVEKELLRARAARTRPRA